MDAVAQDADQDDGQLQCFRCSAVLEWDSEMRRKMNGVLICDPCVDNGYLADAVAHRNRERGYRPQIYINLGSEIFEDWG